MLRVEHDRLHDAPQQLLPRMDLPVAEDAPHILQVYEDLRLGEPGRSVAFHLRAQLRHPLGQDGPGLIGLLVLVLQQGREALALNELEQPAHRRLLLRRFLLERGDLRVQVGPLLVEQLLRVRHVVQHIVGREHRRHQRLQDGLLQQPAGNAWERTIGAALPLPCMPQKY
jgi:hypothetical protein